MEFDTREHVDIHLHIINMSIFIHTSSQQVTFSKRKFGLMKKSFELSQMCDCEVGLILFSKSDKIYQYASTNMDQVLMRYTNFNKAHESKNNADIAKIYYGSPQNTGSVNSPSHEQPLTSPSKEELEDNDQSE